MLSNHYMSIFLCMCMHACLCACFQEFVKLMKLQPGEHVLDVGAGIGGGDFYMAQVSHVSSAHVTVSVSNTLTITRKTVHCLKIKNRRRRTASSAWINNGSGKGSSLWVRRQTTQTRSYTQTPTHTNTHAHHDKLITISAPLYYVSSLITSHFAVTMNSKE